MSVKRASGGRTGRRPGASTTRQEILAAARTVFAAGGYEAATIRAIAAAAGVDPALVIRFYGSKECLFREAVGWPFDPAEAVARIVTGDPAGLGERLARFVVGAWEGEDGTAIVALIRAAGAHEEAARALGEFLTHGIVTPAAQALGSSDDVQRLALVSAQLLGVAFTRYVLRAGPLAEADADDLVAALAPGLQRLLAPDA
jgi:AcrR family transcriptional regulator